jgi:xanthine dehydrogenase iron-sulfur cluster and FAD-binding subunit A
MQYNSQVPPPALFPFFPSNTFLLFNAEALTTGEFSQQVHIPPSPTAQAQAGIRITIDFSAAPGAFEIDIMEDDTDLEGAAHYAQVPVAGVINAPNAGSATQATVDLLPFQGQFLCLYVKTQPANAVTCTARATRR